MSRTRPERSPSPKRRSEDKRKGHSHREKSRDHGRYGDGRRMNYDRSRYDQQERASNRRAEISSSPSPSGRGHKRRRHEEDSPPYHQRSKESPALPSIGQILRGKVHTVKPFGVFIRLDGFEKHALVHHSQISDEVSFGRDDEDADKIAALEYFCPGGAKVFVKIIDIQTDERDGSRVNGSMRGADQESGADKDPTNSLAVRTRGPVGQGGGRTLNEGIPELGSIHKSQVASVKPFGAFIRLEGYRTNGLVHVSQVSDHMDIDKEDSDEAKVAAIGQVLSIGESVWVKVVEIKEAEPGSDRGPKLSCSIKLVSQRDGTDLDPHGLKFRPKPVDGGFGQRKAVGADVGQVQQGTIDWGHLTADKVNLDPKYTEYELLGADAEDIGIGNEQQMGANDLPPPPKKGLKKQQKKQQKLEERGITSVEEALAVLKEHKKKSKHKKEKKEKKAKKTKRKRQSSSES